MEINKNRLPKRKHKKTFRSVTGYFPSKKNGRSVFFESLLEKTLFLTLEFDKEVISYLEQPVKINYKVDNKTRKYHPDCLIDYMTGKSRLVEVKYVIDLIEKKDDLEIKLEQGKIYADANDLIFDVYDETQLDSTTKKNMEFLYSFAFLPTESQTEQTITDTVKQNNELQVSELLELLSTNKYEQAKFLPYVWKLAFEDVLSVDYENMPLNMNSVIRYKHE
jgi:hypothetical protein